MKGLYAITESDSENLLEKARLAFEGGVKILQYRNKSADEKTKLKEAAELALLCREYAACFIINDDIELAKAVGADGVHLGREDGNIEDAKKLLGNEAVIGVTCYQDINNALEAERLGATYVAFGSFFASPSKPDAPRADLSLIRKAKHQLSLPVCCIGGITLENMDPLLEEGADMLAVISSLFAADDIKATAQQFSSRFN